MWAPTRDIVHSLWATEILHKVTMRMMQRIYCDAVQAITEMLQSTLVRCCTVD
jgi:hypothetical protein